MTGRIHVQITMDGPKPLAHLVVDGRVIADITKTDIIDALRNLAASLLFWK